MDIERSSILTSTRTFEPHKIPCVEPKEYGSAMYSDSNESKGLEV